MSVDDWRVDDDSPNIDEIEKMAQRWADNISTKDAKESMVKNYLRNYLDDAEVINQIVSNIEL